MTTQVREGEERTHAEGFVARPVGRADLSLAFDESVAASAEVHVEGANFYPPMLEDIRAAMRHLKQGGFIWYATDQDMRGKDTVFVPFFGVPAATITATHQFARLSGCLVVPFFHRREGADYVLRLGEPFSDFPSKDATADSARVNAAIEAIVRYAPSQYLWIHRRFKRQPEGRSHFYDKPGR